MARRPCIVHGCPEYVEGRGGRCDTHRREHQRTRWDRGLTGARGSRAGWRKLRARVLREQDGKCLAHLVTGRICGAPATVVHHIDEDARNNERGNLVGLCDDCHKAVHRRAVSR